MQKQKKLKQLKPAIQGSIFLDNKLKKQLLENMDKLEGHDLEVLTALFGEAKKRQEDLVDQIVEFDDTFVARLKHFKKFEVAKYASAVESVQRKKEKAEDILKQLD
jgi:hypothetical protein